MAYFPGAFTATEVMRAGSLGATAATTDAQGIASAASWTLGTTAGANAVRATVGSLAPVTFAATGALLALLRPGDHLLTSSWIYGGTRRLMFEELTALGVEVTAVKPVPSRFTT